MKLKLLLFAGLAESLGSPLLELELEEDSLTPSQLKNKLAELYPEIAGSLAGAFVAVNQAYADDSTAIREQDEVALIPPVSGGEPQIMELTHAPISIDQVTAKVLHPHHGAALTFIGTTREFTHGKRTTLLEYEAYEPMALRTLHQIGDEIASRYPGTRCAITHRLGSVPVGEISVIIAVSSPHRDTAYDSSRYAIERLKQIVPIWKKEIWEDGSEWKGHQLGPWNPTSEITDQGGTVS
ncbi:MULTISPECIES: molybdopterin converting factor subunit 1 [unclassified Paenibacillus]|uniref:molybdopterin converting factor subunit 1 n=1 Tax=unclassified Paenibacillus TaxID=185978 RepID=UPI001AEB4903|nr:MULTISPECIES: molybdopterin converting factor subunit 1 [unclassified Paenibacillus]MBP1154564.1 molybdopterin synthase catalytic subunit [Paenibacillus sp. PvP091]MBP1170052.1 molybdopterin synthase catalytic subunit [Paenibacillus sp. PvR098]MBP2441080.1 molybdopterin synthase catalytic subunit [Paenibacillus sp. PvP052]